ncbi:MAG: hypothetical protein IPP57_23255 [Candidatus Obscuribacter sp.]|nr:hypothetical protein [Candidatus Obscuribacter sp.]
MRSSIENAIWLCQLCATLIDKDPKKFSAITLGEWKLKAESKYGMDLENRYPTANELVDPEQTAAENDILLGAIDGYEGNMIVFGERNGWDTVNLVGENYDTSQIERSLYVQAILNLMESGHVQRRGTDRAYELTFKGLKRAYALRDSGGHRRQPGQIV